MKYEVSQSPEYNPNGRKRRNPLRVIDMDSTSGRKNLRSLYGAFQLVKGHPVEIDASSFTDEELLRKLKGGLEKRAIDFTLI